MSETSSITRWRWSMSDAGSPPRSRLSLIAVLSSETRPSAVLNRVTCDPMLRSASVRASWISTLIWFSMVVKSSALCATSFSRWSDAGSVAAESNAVSKAA